jgi:ribonuclease D
MDSMIPIIKQENLNSICAEIDKLGRFALDLEFIPEKTYKPVLALLQIATDNGVYIVDPLAKLKFDELWQKVANAKITKVLHAAKEDLNIIRDLSGLVPHNIFDTQLAAGFLGQGFPVGYKKLLDQTLKVQINKSESFTDWLCRPLTKLQMEYAFEDVYHLLPLADKLVESLQMQNRLDWVLDECASFFSRENSSESQDYTFTKIKGARALSRQKLAILKSLCDLRIDEAKQSNRPLKIILSDITLLELSRKAPSSIDSFEQIRGINIDQAKRLGKKIILAIETALSLAQEDWPTWPSSYLVSDNENLAGDTLYAILKIEAYQLQIAPELLATRNEIQKLINCFNRNCHTEKDIPILRSWRGDIVGKKLLSILEGSQVQLKLNLKEEPSAKISF